MQSMNKQDLLKALQLPQMQEDMGVHQHLQLPFRFELALIYHEERTRKKSKDPRIESFVKDFFKV